MNLNNEKVIQQDSNEIIMNMFRERAKGISRMTQKEWEDLDWDEDDIDENKKGYKAWKKDKEYIEDWLKDVVKPSKSPKTYKQYKSAIRIFFRWNLDENDGIPIYKLKKRAYLKYKNWLLEDCLLASDSIKMKKSALSSFFNFIEQYIAEEDDNYETFRNPLRGLNLDIEKNKVYDKKPVTYKEFKEVQDYLLKDEVNDIMYAIWTCLFYTGNRISEIIQMKLVHCDLEIPKGEMMTETPDYIRGKGRGKQGKLVKFKLTKECLKAMNYWKGKRQTDCESELLFALRNKKNAEEFIEIGDEYIRNYFKDIISPFLERRVTPHNMRASFSTYLLEQGVDIAVVKDWLNHESIETTSNFYDLRDKTKLTNAALKGIKL